MAAVEAVPLEGIQEAFRPLRFDDKADRSRDRSLRRMAYVRRYAEDIAFIQFDVVVFSAIDQLENHVAFELIEEFIDRIVVKVGALIGTADYRNHQIGLRPDLLIADRRLQLVAILVDPVL